MASTPDEDFTVSFCDIPMQKRQSLPNRRVSRSKSHASFVIAPKRTSETVIPVSGETTHMEYSQLKRIIPIQNTHSTTIPISTSTFIPWAYLKSVLTTPILKASFTYFIASLFVYVPQIANCLGSTDSKHIVCTVVVYFHSSRTVGSMIQSLMFVAISLIFGITVSVSTLKVISLMLNQDNNPATILDHPIPLSTDIETFSIILTLLICSTALGTISFFKHRISKATFNTSCSLCAILIISCLIKDFSKIFNSTDPNSPVSIPWDRILSSIECILTGCIISVTICFTLWRESAKNNLINNLNEVEQLCGSTVAFLCDSFMVSWDSNQNDDPETQLKLLQDSKLETLKIFNDLQTKLNKLDSCLEETQFETYISGREKEYALLNDLVYYEKKMAVNLGSLSRAVEFKWDILQECQTQRLHNMNNETDEDDDYDLTTHDFLNVIETDSTSNGDPNDSILEEPDSNAVIEPQELFDLFFYYIGPSTKSFVYTMKEILNDPMFNQSLKVKNVVNQYERSLGIAKSLYQDHQLKAIDSVYKQDIFSKDYNFDGKVSHEEIAATCANFSYSLTQFSIELQTLLTTLTLLNQSQASNSKSFEFLKFWKASINKNPIIESLDLERGRVFNTFNNYSQNSNNKLTYKIWELTKFFRGVDFQFGLRVAMGSLILGSFAFMPLTSHIFNEWRGEWILVTFCIIMNKSLGGTVMTVKWRFLGTFVGAFTAYWVWVFFYPDVFLLALSGFIVSIPCFGIILNWKSNNAFGRFILLTYNLTVLYSYTMSLNHIPIVGDGDDWEGGDTPIIFEIAFHRYIGVSIGVIWAVIITLTLFPMSARARVKQGLTTLWLRMGLIWKAGPLSSFNEFDSSGGSKLIGLNGLNGCHLIHSELLTLNKQAPMELRMKGDYPTDKYQTLIDCTGNIIDSFENMNSIIDIDPMLSSIEINIINDLKIEIKELENRVFLMFYMLSSAMTLRMPLMARAAGTEYSMEKVIAKLSDVRRQTIAIQRSDPNNKEGQILNNEEFVLFFTYCLVTEAVVKQLNIMMVEVVGLFDKLDEDLLELL